MRFVQFLDEASKLCWGHDLRDDGALLLDGDPLGGFQELGRRARVAALRSPVTPRAILAIGLNYRDHAAETGQPLPDSPVLFMKNPAAVQHPGEPIILPRAMVEQPEVDYEVELAVIIGKPARDVPQENALDYVLGYTVANDVSARRVQKHGGAGQWVRGKSFDTFCPLGPVLVTPDEIPDPQRLRLRTVLNGEVMQDSNTSEMIFSVAELIAYLSTDMTLLPGTVIMTGTPAGVGFTRNPRVFLKPGDELNMTIESIGTLTSPVVSA